MHLSEEQILEYRDTGVVSFPGLITEQEIAALKAEQRRLFELDIDCHLRADSGELLGTTAMHWHSDLYRRLLSDERLLGVAEQLLGAGLYCHQYKIIIKNPFGKLSLPWHQDYAPWVHHDGMPKPLALSIGIFLDEVSEFNGPIYYIPGSHRKSLIDYEFDVSQHREI